MRLWRDEPPTQDKPSRRHEYEVVGYVITGRAELEIEGQPVRLEPGTPGSPRRGRAYLPHSGDVHGSRSDRSSCSGTWAREVLASLRQPPRSAEHDSFQAFKSPIALLDVFAGPPLHLNGILARFLDLVLAKWADHQTGPSPRVNMSDQPRDATGVPHISRAVVHRWASASSER
jgi:hypothetical protein